MQWRRYWKPDPRDIIHHKDPRDYVAQYGALFSQAVRDRLRSENAVGFYLSGGLDSSAVYCMAAKAKLQENGKLPELRSVSFAYEQLKGADEIDYCNAVYEQWPVRHRIFDGRKEWLLKYYGTDEAWLFDEPNGTNTETFLRGLAWLREEGVRVVLDGHGGDNVFLGGAYGEPALMWDQPTTAWRDEIRWSRRRGFSRREVVRQAFGLPGRLLAWGYDRVKGPQGTRPKYCLASPELLGRVCLDVPPLEVPPFRYRSHRRLYESLTDMMYFGYWQDSWERDGSFGGVKFEHPFLDRRLVEFLLATPPVHLNRRGTTKYLLRESQAGILPEKVRVRRSKAYFDHMYTKSFREHSAAKIQTLLENSESVRRGFVEAETLRTVVDEVMSGAPYVSTRKLQMVVSLEIWLVSQIKPREAESKFKLGTAG